MLHVLAGLMSIIQMGLANLENVCYIVKQVFALMFRNSTRTTSPFITENSQFHFILRIPSAQQRPRSKARNMCCTTL